MKIMLMTDMEACAGVLNAADWVVPGGHSYEQGKRLLTEETNAAIDGLFAGGATEVLVVDGHGAGGINPELLDERALLMRGFANPPYPLGLDASFAALAFVGQHAKAGTPRSHLTHTQWWSYIDLAVNGISIGEYGQTALCAMELGIPTILACGEAAFAAEAAALTPGVVTVTVKWGLLEDGLDDLDGEAYSRAKLGAIHLSPQRARRLIRDGALQAVTRLREAPQSFGYPDLRPPYIRTARFRHDGATPASTARDEHPSSFIALMNLPYTKVS
ncbi:MAG TPA: M55 family metallopeptidase [Abditibacteriaceae bacterium]|nr:M55 family metallopeptidase [Abditibacteriaceae bacterium]